MIVAQAIAMSSYRWKISQFKGLVKFVLILDFQKKRVADYFPFQLHQIRMIFCKSVFSGFRPHQLSVWDESDLNAEALVEWDTGPVCRCILFRTVTLVLSAVDKTNKRSVSKRLSLIFCNGCWLFVRTAAYKLTAQILTLEKETFTRWAKMLHEYFFLTTYLHE